MTPLVEQGWECPKCARVWSPLVKACAACNDRQTLDHIPLKPPPPYTNIAGWFTDAPDFDAGD